MAKNSQGHWLIWHQDVLQLRLKLALWFSNVCFAFNPSLEVSKVIGVPPISSILKGVSNSFHINHPAIGVRFWETIFGITDRDWTGSCRSPTCHESSRRRAPVAAKRQKSQIRWSWLCITSYIFTIPICVIRRNSSSFQLSSLWESVSPCWGLQPSDGPENPPTQRRNHRRNPQHAALPGQWQKCHGGLPLGAISGKSCRERQGKEVTWEELTIWLVAINGICIHIYIIYNIIYII
jgi:hypothetical protein